TAQGQLKRSAATEYDVRRQKFAALNLRPEDRLFAVLWLNPALDMLLLTRNGMSIRFHTDALPVMGRVAGGVKGMTLESADEIIWCAQPMAVDQILLISDRGFAKRILFMDFEPQSRAGKGVKCFYFNKSGSNGLILAGAALLSTPSTAVRVLQAISNPTILMADDVISQGKQDKGMPYVMAVLDDVVNGLEPFEPEA
ncbi:MAG: DNA gyrase C-terminal beta-propeller domain-containing protein, partial [Clostridia bacterium]